MPRRNWQLFVEDIVNAILRTQHYYRGANFESFCSDEKTMDAVLRNIAVIGEAARYVPEEIVARHPEIPWNEMRDMRNVVIHGYFGIATDR